MQSRARAIYIERPTLMAPGGPVLHANIAGQIGIESVQLSQHFQPASDQDRLSPAESAFSAPILLLNEAWLG